MQQLAGIDSADADASARRAQVSKIHTSAPARDSARVPRNRLLIVFVSTSVSVLRFSA